MARTLRSDEERTQCGQEYPDALRVCVLRFGEFLRHAFSGIRCANLVWNGSFAQAQLKRSLATTRFCRIRRSVHSIQLACCFLKIERIDMLNAKAMRFSIDVILVCIIWYAEYALSYWHLDETMQERGALVDGSSVNRRAFPFLPLLEKAFR